MSTDAEKTASTLHNSGENNAFVCIAFGVRLRVRVSLSGVHCDMGNATMYGVTHVAMST